jgi:hypothetical protein
MVTGTTGPSDDLAWNASAVAMLMFEHGIHSRAALAKTLGSSRASVNRTFDDSWNGRATPRMIAALCVRFRVPMNRLVLEPAVAVARVKNRQVKRFSDRCAQ